MAKYHLFQRNRNNNYNYIDNVTKTYIEMGGCLVNIYPLIGVVKEDGTVLPITESGEQAISDVVLNENNKRKYSHTTYDMYMTTTMNPPNFSWSYAGISVLDGDVKEFSLHYNTMIEILGRKIIVGDVFEMTWMRDSDILGSDKGQNKFFVVTSSERDEAGWGPEWHYHLWKVKCKPISDSPEYADLFNTEGATGGEDGFYAETGDENGGGGLDKDASQDTKLQEQVDETLAEAEGEDGSEENGWTTSGVSYRLHDEHHIFMSINDKYYITDKVNCLGKENIVGIDGIPAELNCSEVPYGEFFPKNAKEGDYFLRTDYLPPRLYKRIYTKTTNNTVDLICGDISLTKAELNLTGHNFDGSIKVDNILKGSILKDRVYIDGSYVGYVTETGKIVNNSGLIIGEINSTDVVHKKGWVLEELDRRERWTGVPARLRNVINNENTFENEDGDTIKMRQNIKDLAKARIKKEHDKDRPWNKTLQEKIGDETGIEYDIIGIKK